MTEQTPLSVVLSQEELFVILAYLKVKSLMGLDPRVLDDLSEKEIRLVMGVAERALIARGFLGRGGDQKMQLHPAILALVGACAAPEQSLIMTQARLQAFQENLFFHTARQMIVVHTIPLTAVHQFVMLEDKDGIAKAVLSALKLDDKPAPPCAEGYLPDEMVTMARDAAQEEGQDAAEDVLSQSELPTNTAREFAASLAMPIANTTLVALRHRPEQDLAEGFTILEGANGLWLLKPENNLNGHADKSIALRPVSTQEVVAELKALLEFMKENE